MTNRQFASSDELFIVHCLRANVRPTKRQASKFRGRKRRGAAYRRSVLGDDTCHVPQCVALDRHMGDVIGELRTIKGG